MDGGADNDELLGFGGADVMRGGAGADRLYGHTIIRLPRVADDGARDELFGDAGADELSGCGGADVLYGGADNDILFGDYDFRKPARLLPPDDGAADTLHGESGNDTLHGQDGVDVLLPGLGNDVVDGGSGVRDTVSYADVDAGVEVSLRKRGAQNTVGAGVDRLRNCEDLEGGSGDDILAGDALGNRIDGRDGDDAIIGDGGRDTLSGGDGADTFSFLRIGDSTGVVPDRIADFSRRERDRIDLELIDADVTKPGNQAFSFVGIGLIDAPGELSYAGGLLQGDVDGDGDADLAIIILGAPVLTRQDLLL